MRFVLFSSINRPKALLGVSTKLKASFLKPKIKRVPLIKLTVVEVRHHPSLNTTHICRSQLHYYDVNLPRIGREARWSTATFGTNQNLFNCWALSIMWRSLGNRPIYQQLTSRRLSPSTNQARVFAATNHDWSWPSTRGVDQFVIIQTNGYYFQLTFCSEFLDL